MLGLVTPPDVSKSFIVPPGSWGWDGPHPPPPAMARGALAVHRPAGTPSTRPSGVGWVRLGRSRRKENDMEITPLPSTQKGPAEWFTGDVWFDVLAAPPEPARLRVNAVR